MNHKPFRMGMKSILSVKWIAVLKTPLVIRNGGKSAWKTQSENTGKGRNQGIEYAWTNASSKLNKDSKREKEPGWSELTDFNYHFIVENNKVRVEYSIPSSSVRGALRQWTIKCLTERDDWKAFYIPKKEELEEKDIEELIEKVNIILSEKTHRWNDILSLFGIAYDLHEDKEKQLSWSGRMQIQTSLPTVNDPKIAAQGTWASELNTADGPNNINRHVTVRNPLDRVSHGAKEGGLHQFVEMSEGERFCIDFKIMNPVKTDLDIINIWISDINAGFLRFGGLTSQGRGRVEIESQNYCYFFNNQYKIDTSYIADKKDLLKGDLLENLWHGYQFGLDELSSVLE